MDTMVFLAPLPERRREDAADDSPGRRIAGRRKKTARRGVGETDDRQAGGWPANWPSGLTDPSGARVGRYFSREELTRIAGKIIQRGIGPGWRLHNVVEILGTPTKVSRMGGSIGMSPEDVREFMGNPLIPPDVKANMNRVTVRHIGRAGANRNPSCSGTYI